MIYLVVRIRIDVSHAVAVVHVRFHLAVVRYGRYGPVRAVFSLHIVFVGLD